MKCKPADFEGNGGTYRVVHDLHGIKGLYCQFCDFAASRMEYRRGSDRSGQGRYNRMRAAIVKHLHERHREILEWDSPEDSARKIAESPAS